MSSRRRVLAISIGALLWGCGADTGADAGAADAGGGVDAAAAADAGHDAGGADAGGGVDGGGADGGGADGGGADGGGTDGGVADAGSDAGPLDAGPFECGALGVLCEPTDAPCPDGMECLALDSLGEGVCVRSRAICGGFAGAMCPDPFPVCLVYSSASGWPCVTDAERDCICATSAGRARFDVCAP